jgi:hypothetical protein
MRELTLLETGYLATLLVLSLVLPLLMSMKGPREGAARKACMMMVWLGQACIALAGFGVLVSGALAPSALAFGVLSCVGFAVILSRKLRAATCA